VIDVEPLIVAGLDRLVPLPSGERADWQDVLGRSGETRRRRWLGVPRPSAWSRLQIAVVAIVVGLMLAAAATATYIAIRNGGPAFGVAQLTPRQMVTPDVNHTSYRDTRLWGNAAGRLSGEIEVFGDLRRFSTALQAAIQESNSLEPESHSNRCYRWIVIYRNVLNDLQTEFRALSPVTQSSGRANEFAWKAKRANHALRLAAGHVWGACVRDQDRP